MRFNKIFKNQFYDYHKNHLPRILCISPYFAPLANSEAFCSAKIVKQLMEQDISITVLCVDYGHKSPKFSNDHSKLWESLREVTIRIPPHSNKNKLFSIFGGVRYQTVTWVRWIDSVVNQAKILHNDHPFDVVYSRSLPMMAHIAAYWIVSLFKIPWIANINDPWDLDLIPYLSEKSQNGIHSIISQYWLRKVFNTADLLTFPSTRLRDFHLKIADTNRRCEIIPHVGYSTHKKSQISEFRLVHAGKLGSGESTRENTTLGLLKALKRFLQVHKEAPKVTRLMLIGPVDRQTQSIVNKLGLQSVVRSTGIVSYEDSLEYISTASICILVEGKFNEGIFLPSKLADYIAAQKPILALSPKVGVVADMVPRNGIVRVDVDDEEAIEAAITNYYRAFKHNVLKELIPSEELVRQFEPETIAKLFISNVQEIVRPELKNTAFIKK